MVFEDKKPTREDGELWEVMWKEEQETRSVFFSCMILGEWGDKIFRLRMALHVLEMG